MVTRVRSSPAPGLAGVTSGQRWWQLGGWALFSLVVPGVGFWRAGQRWQAVLAWLGTQGLLGTLLLVFPYWPFVLAYFVGGVGLIYGLIHLGQIFIGARRAHIGVARWFSVLGYTAVALALGATMALNAGVESFKVPSRSMQPTLAVGDYFFVLRTGELSAMTRGSVVVFWNQRAQTNYVKRLIGVPGDVVSWDGKQLTLNDEVITGELCVDAELGVGSVCRTESIDGHSWRILTGNAKDEVFGTWEVPEGHVFMLGDARNNSLDGRVDGFVAEEDLVGPAVVVHFSWPNLSRIGNAL